jgi:DNA mismatch repair protein MutH
VRAPLTAKSRARKTRALVIASAPFDWLPRGCERAETPETEAELLARARRLAGHTVADLARHLERPLPTELSRAKGLIGDLVERALGADPTASSAPDFPALGIELKTIPCDRRGRPRESTFVCTAQMQELAELDWARSRVRRKLSRVLWLPIEAEPQLPLAARRIGSARLWEPTAAQADALRADWEELAGWIGRGEMEQITAHVGHYLQLRPKARDGGVRRPGRDEQGAPLRAAPRGFYLRAAFTATILI